MCACTTPLTIGSTCAIVLLGEQGTAIPALLRVHAKRTKSGLRFVAPCPIAPVAREHISTVLVRVAHALVAANGVSRCGWHLSLELPAAATLNGESVQIEGNSADLAIVTAMVSAALCISVRPDVAMTGQLRNETGRVEMVGGLDKKLTLADPAIEVVLVPDWKGDTLFAQLHPEEFVSVRTQVKASNMRVVVVKDIHAALRYATTPKPTPAESVQNSTHESSEIPETLNTDGADERIPEGDRTAARTLVEALSEKRLVSEIDSRIEGRLATFRPERLRVDSVSELLVTVESLLAHIGEESSITQTIQLEAPRLIETAYANEGGVNGALVDAQTSSMRTVINRVVDELKDERRSIYVRGVLAKAIDPLDGAKRLSLLRGLFSEFGAVLPHDVRLAAPERFANHVEQAVMALLATRNLLSRRFAQ